MCRVNGIFRPYTGEPVLSAINWLGICRNPVVDMAIVEPCEILVTPNGFGLTTERQRILKCLAGGGLLLIPNPSEAALLEAQTWTPVIGCGNNANPSASASIDGQ